jgi:hypothetical protein
LRNFKKASKIGQLAAKNFCLMVLEDCSQVSGGGGAFNYGAL